MAGLIESTPSDLFDPTPMGSGSFTPDKPPRKDVDLSDVVPKETPNLLDLPTKAQYEGYGTEMKKAAGGFGQETDTLNAYTNKRLAADRARMDRASRSTEAAADSLPPEWNADKERADRIQGPFERFGSAATIFAMIASGFSRQPMTAALTAGAAAMDSIHKSDLEGYDKAYQAWKDNTTLAVKRFDMEHRLFEDSQQMFNTDITQWAAVNKMNAAKFDNKKMLALLNHGMYPEAFQYMSSMVNLNNSFRESLEQGQMFNSRQQEHRAYMENVANEHGPKGAGDWDINQAKTASFLHTEMLKTTPGSVERIVATGALKEFERTGKLPDEHKLAELRREATRLYGSGASGNTKLTENRDIEAAVQRKSEQWRKEGYSEDDIDNMKAAERNRLQALSKPTSPNRIDDLRSLDARFKYSIETIDKVEGLLKKHNALTGLGGKITRPGEVVSNWFGSSATDRAQFESYINELRFWSAQLLNESKTRQLSAQEREIVKIVPGLEAGSSTK